MRWPEEDDQDSGGDGSTSSYGGGPAAGTGAGTTAMGSNTGVGGSDAVNELLPNLSPTKRAADVAAAARLLEPEPEPEPKFTSPTRQVRKRLLFSPFYLKVERLPRQALDENVFQNGRFSQEEGGDAPLALPEGWTEHWDDEHRCFFYVSISRTSVTRNRS
jgi:hypothetical protein